MQITVLALSLLLLGVGLLNVDRGVEAKASLAAAPAMAVASIVVTNTDDGGPGSLRQAIADAAPGDTITFNLANCPCAITLTSGELVIDKNLTIQGLGANVLTVSGNNASRVFRIESSTVTLSGLKIANGNGVSPNNNHTGGIRC